MYELQGDLRFATIEPLLREISVAGDALQFLVLDFKRVAHADQAATLLAGAHDRELRRAWRSMWC